MANWNTHLLFKVLLVLCISMDAMAQEAIVGETDHYSPKELKRKYKERFGQLDIHAEALKTSLKEYKDTFDTLTSDKILSSFANISQLVKSKVSVPEPNELKTAAESRVSKRYTRTYHRLNRQWESRKAEWQQYARQDSALKNYWQDLKSDSVLLARAEQRLTDHFAELVKERQLPTQQDPESQVSDVLKQFDEFTDPDQAYKQLLDGAFEYSDEALKSLTKDAAAGPLAKKDALVEDAHNLMWKLKQKYSYIQNSNDLSTAIKENSLQSYAFGQRLRLGGNFQFHPTERGLKIDLSPNLGYRINKQLLLGISGFYRAGFGRSDASEPDQVYGASVFAQQILFRGFFLHAEGEYASAKTPVVHQEITNRANTNSLLLGIGKEFLLTRKLNGTATWLYHFNHINTLAYKSPWIFRLGINLNQIAN